MVGEAASEPSLSAEPFPDYTKPRYCSGPAPNPQINNASTFSTKTQRAATTSLESNFRTCMSAAGVIVWAWRSKRP